MSNKLDERVVEMKFDNSQFEKNVKNTIVSLDQLKQGLNFDGIGNGIVFVGQKFSALEKIATGALMRIGSQAVDSGQRLLKSLTIEQLSVGWEKFAEKTTSVQTIMAATRETWQDSADSIERTTYLMSQGVDKTIANSLARQASNIKDGTVSATEAIEQSGGQATQAMLNLANRMADVTYQGDQMSFVSEQLQRLNWFTDETSYKLVDMANNIGKFTSAGVGLDEAVSAMEGIATWAAISGGNANSASSAMYNMSQALGSGAVLAVDWKSIENQNMATAEFKQIVIETAEELGTLNKVSEDVYMTMDGHEVTVKNFRENLKDRWFSDEVLMGSLQKYGDFAVELQQVAAETDLSAKELLDSLTVYKEAAGNMGEYLVKQGINEDLANGVADRYKKIASGMMTMEEAAEELGTTPEVLSDLTKRLDGFMDGAVDFEAMLKEIKSTCPDTTLTVEDLRKEFNLLTDDTMDLGMRAFKAAQEAKTFQEAIDYVREAVSTGWLNTFEKVFGNYEEAKELWSNLAEEFYTIFVEAGDIRNSILETWKQAGGRDDLVEAFWNIFHAITGIVSIIKEAANEIFKPLFQDTEGGAARLWTLTKRLRDFTEGFKLFEEAADGTKKLTERGEQLKRTFKGVFAIFGIVKDVIVALVKPVLSLIPSIGELGGTILGATADFGDWLVQLRETIRTSGVLEEITNRLSLAFAALGDFIGNMLQIFRGVSYWEAGGGLAGIIESIFDSVANLLRLFFDVLSALTGKDFSNLRDKVIDSFFDIRNFVVNNLGPLGEFIQTAFQWIKDSVVGLWQTLKSVDFGSPGEKISSALHKAADGAESVKIKFEDVKNFFAKMKPAFQGILKFFGAIAYGIGKVLGYVGDMVMNYLKNASVQDVVQLLLDLSKAFLSFRLGGFLKSISKFNKSSSEFMDALSEFINRLKKSTESFGTQVLKFAFSMAMLAAAVYVISKIDTKAMLSAGGVIAALMLELALITKFMGKTSKKGKEKEVLDDGVKSVIALSIAVSILASAIKKIADIDTKNLWNATAVIAVLVAVTALATKLTSDSKSSAMFGLIGMALAILILTKTIQKLAILPWEEMKTGMIALGLILAALTASLAIIGATAKNESFGKLVGQIILVLAIASAIKRLVKIMVTLSEMSGSDLTKGILSIIVLLGALTLATKGMSKSAMGAGGLLAISAALVVFVLAVKKMSDVSWESIAKSLIVFAGALIILGGLAFILAAVAPVMTKLALTFALIGVGVYLLAKAAPLLADTVKAIVDACMVLIDEIIGLLPRIMASLNKALTSTTVELVELVVNVIKILCAGIIACSPDIMEALVVLIDDALTALANHSESICNALIDIFIIGPLKSINSRISEIISLFVELANTLMDALTTAFGQISPENMTAALLAFSVMELIMLKLIVVEGLALLAMLPLPEIAEKLGEFASGLKPFFEVLRTVKPEQVLAAKYLAEMLLLFTKSTVAEAATSWWTGGTDIVAFGKTLSEFAPYVKKFSDGIDGIDVTAIAASVEAIEALAGVTFPDISYIGDVDETGTEILKIAQLLVDYNRAISSLDSDSIDSIKDSAEAAAALVSVASAVPNEGGLAGILAGDNNIALFGTFLESFGLSLVAYGSIVEDLNAESVNESIEPAKSVIEIAKAIPNEGGLAGLIAGNNDMHLFGKFLESFGTSLYLYGVKVYGLKSEAITDSVEPAKALIEIAKLVPNEGGVWGWLAGNNNLDDFGGFLEQFGESLVDYADTVEGTDFSDVEASAQAAAKIMEFATNIPKKKKVEALTVFGPELVEFGKNLAKYGKKVSSINKDKIVESATAAAAIVEVANNIPNEGGWLAKLIGDNQADAFGKKLGAFGEGLAAYGDAVVDIDKDKIVESTTAASAIIEVANSVPNEGGWLAKLVGDNQVDVFGSKLGAFGEGLAAYGTAIVGLSVDDIVNSKEAGMAIIEMAKQIPNSDGWLGKIFGENDADKFGQQLPVFGAGIKSFGDNISGFKSKTVIAKKDGVTTIIDLFKSIPQQEGGWFSNVFGESDMAIFCDQLRAFAAGIVDFSVEIADVNSYGVSTASTLVPILTDFLKALPDEATGLVDIAADLDVLGPSLKTFSSNISGITSTPFYQVKTGVDYLTGISVEDLSPVLEALTDLVSIVTSIEVLNGTGATAMALSLETLASTGISAMVDAFADTESVTTEIENFVDAACTAASGKSEDLNDAAISLADGFVDKFIYELKQKKKSLGSAVNGLVTKVRSYRQSFVNAGLYLVLGFTRGISDNKWRAEAAAKAMAKAAKIAAEKELDEESPSKEGYRIGNYFVQGFVNPFYDRINDVRKAGSNLASETIDATNEVIRKVADFISTGMDAQPTIRPVLDLTDVSDGFNSLNAMFSRRQAVGISARMNDISLTGTDSEQLASTSGGNWTFIQNNNSPKALSTAEIYRQTRNQFSKMKGWAERK